MQFKNYDYYSDEAEHLHKKEIAIINAVKTLEKELPTNKTTKTTRKKNKL